ncbi:inosose isomerase [Klebsiella pneumoniae]|uniref:Inosose isomerase n=1 Tax=Klebsiella pneumoniae TaxID=573 RepID=A0A2X1QMX2_KLEPN|nr:inosose isomerase [Klebsiella pneumoniae]
MKTIKGRAFFLAQFIGPQAPFNTLAGDSAVGRRPGVQGIADPLQPPGDF